MKLIVTLIIVLSFTLIVKAQVEKTIVVKSGSLNTMLTPKELNTITNLTVLGTMDARDFKTIHDEMPLLIRLDITKVTIEAFTLFEFGEEIHYPANAIPQAHAWNNDFNSEHSLAGHSTLSIIKLPVSLTAIGYMAFNYCTSLTSIKIPSPVSQIEHYTFFNCTALESIILPSTITYIGVEAFFGCTSLKSIYCHAIYPPELDANQSVYEVLSGINKTTCILYIPFGTKELYKNAGEWGNFNNIIEMSGIFLSANKATIEAMQGNTSSILITSDVSWTATSNQPWLEVSPLYGKGVHTLTFTADANTADATRTGTATVSAPGFDPQTIIITQNGLTTGVAEMTQNRPLINCYPNPFADITTLKIHNPKNEQLIVDIYDMSGQRLKNLTILNKTEKITLTWDGTNEQGQQVPKGMYLLKMNEQVKKVVFGK